MLKNAPSTAKTPIHVILTTVTDIKVIIVKSIWLTVVILILKMLRQIREITYFQCLKYFSIEKHLNIVHQTSYLDSLNN